MVSEQMQLKTKKINPFWYKLKQNKLTLFGIALLALIIVLAIIVPIFSPHDPNKVDLANKFQSPSAANWFGTDEVGRDIFTRIFYGAFLSLGLGILIIFIAAAIGTIIGCISGYLGGIVDTIIMRLVDMVLAFPSLILAMALAAVLGPNIQNAMIAIAIVKVPVYIRLARAEALSIKEKLYVKSAETFGINRALIITKHIIPNAISPVIIQATLDIGDTILLIATLGFLGLGAQPPTPEWGAMISVGWKYLLTYWWYPVFPGLFLFLAAGALNLIGDGIRDVLDPKSAR
jgi:peptide/nickel transport system permease protein